MPRSAPVSAQTTWQPVAVRCHGWPGMCSARRSVAFLDGRSESVGESYSRVVMMRTGVPRPTLQYEVRDGLVLVGRADFGWDDLRTLGEFEAPRWGGNA